MSKRLAYANVKRWPAQYRLLGAGALILLAFALFGTFDAVNVQAASIGTYDQCSNDDGDGYATVDLGCRWINGNLQSNNSTYAEGDATVQRLWLDDMIPGSPHSVRLKYGTTKGGAHAYDYLTTWNYSENWITDADLCQDIDGNGNAAGGLCTAWGADDLLAIPVDPNPAFAADGVPQPAGRNFTMRNGDMTSATVPAVTSGTYAGDSETIITISFTVGSDPDACVGSGASTRCSVVLWFGAHVSLTSEWETGGGAGGISGSPYHVALDQLDGASIGQRDNQMQSGAVIPNGTIVIAKDAVPNDPQDFSFNLTNGTTVDLNFLLDDDANVTLPSSQSFSVPPGAYTATELNIPAGWTLTNLQCVDPTLNTTVNIGTATATINLASAETVTCTYTDTNAGHIIVDKVTSPSGESQSFAFTTTGTGYTGFSLTDAGTPNDQALAPGTYSVSETVPTGWDLTSSSCTSSIGDTEAPGSIELDAGETVSCTFNNTKQNPSLSISKTITSAGPYNSAGDVITYQIVVTNTGNQTLTNVSVSDPLISDLDCDGTAGLPYVTTGFTLAVAATLTCTGSYTVTQADIDDNGGGDGDIDNTATADSDQTGPETDSAAAPIVQSPSLSISKTITSAGPYDSAGSVITYQIVVTNTGNQTLTNVSVSDPRISDLDCDGTAGLPYVTTGFTVAPLATLTCTGSYTVTQGDIDDNGGGDGDIDNTATADSDQTGPETDSASAPLVQGPSLTISKTITSAGPYDSAGDAITYQIVVTNTGNQTLTNVSVSDPRISDLDCDGTAGLPYVTTGFTLAPLATLTCTGSYTLTQGDIDDNGGGDGDIDNTATADSNETGPETDSAAAPIVQSPSLTISKTITSAGPYNSAGDAITYQIVVTNTGNQTLTGVSVSDPRISDLDCDGTAGLPYVTTGFTLAPLATLTCTGSYTLTQGDIDDNGGGDGDIDNTATADSNETGPETDSAAAPIVQSPTLTISKTITSAGPYDSAGDAITYQIVVTNTGNQTLTNVSVSDPRISDLDCDGTAGLPYVTTGFTLAPLATLTCTGSYTLTQGDIDDNGGGDGDIDNTATADSDQTGPETDSAAAPIVQSPALSISKTITSAGPYDSAGDAITYQIVVTNTGNQTLTNVSVSDPRISDLDCDGTAGLPYVTTGFTLAPLATLTCTGSYTLTQGDIDDNGGGDGDIDNTATADSDQTGPETDSASAPLVQSPALSISKTITSAGPYDSAGDVISYQIVVTNTGNQTLTNVSVSDPLISDLDCDGTAGLPYVTTGFTLAPLATLTCTGSYTLTQGDIDDNGGGDGDIDNTATADSNETGPETDSAAAPIVQSPTLTISKTITSAGPYNSAGDVITYQIVVTNTGNQTLTNVSVSDPLISDLDCDGTAGLPYVTTGFTLAPLATLTCTGSYTLTQGDIDDNGGGDGDIDNTATADSDQTGPETDSAAAPIVQSPALSISKTITSAGPYDSAGDAITYQIVVTNTGNQTLTNVSVSDPRISDLDCDGTAGLPYVTTGFTLAPLATLTCTGSYTLTQGDIDDNGGGDGDIDNTATADSDQTGPETDSASAPLVQSPALSISKTITSAGPYDSAGSVITYQIVVTNTGNQTLTNVSVSDPLISDLDCDGTAGLPYVTTGFTLAPLATLTCTGSYTLTQGDIDDNGGGDGDIDNTATADSNETGPETDSAAAPIVQSPTLTISKTITSAGPYDSAGDVLTYQIVVTNTGNQTLTNVSVSDPLISDLDCDGTAGLPYVTTGFTLAPLATLTCTGSYTVTQGDIDDNGGGDGDIDNTATADSDQTGPETDSAAAPIVQSPTLTISKTITSAGPYDSAGSVITYQIVVTNTGNQTLTNVSVSDPLISDLDCDGTAGLPYVTTGFTLAPLATLTCTGSYTVTQGDIDDNGGGDGDIDNTATADSDQTGPETDSAAAPIVQSPALTISKTITSAGPYDSAGSVITYQIVVTNTGNQTLTNVSVSDPLISDLDCDGTAGLPYVTTGFTLAPLATLTCTGSYTLTQGDIDDNGGGDGDIDNTATADSNETGPETDSAAAPIVQSPTLTISKTITSAGPYDSAGDVITYQIVVTNTGNQTLTNVSVSDPLISDLDCDGTAGLPYVTTGFTLAPLATLTCTGSYTLTQGDIDDNGGGDGDIDNTATADSNETGPETDSAAAPIVQSPTLTISKTITSAGPYNSAGDVITYQIVVTNTGNQTLTGVSVSDPRISDLDCDGTAGLPYVTTGFTLAPLATLTCTGSYTLTQGDIDDNGGGDGDIDNTATADSNETGPETDSAAAPIVQSPTLTISKTITSAGPYDSAGSVITYQIVVTNTGNQTLTNVSVSDPLISDLDCDGTAGLPYVTTGFTLAPLATLTCTGSYTLTQGDIDDNGGGDGDIDNTATADSNETGPETDSAAAPIVQGPSLSISKTITSAGPYDSAGDVITYQIVVTNTGNQTLTGVSVSDPRISDLDCDGTAGLPYVTTGFTLAPLATLTCTGSYTVTQGDIDDNGGGDGDIDNTATADSDQTGPETDSAAAPIVQSPALTIVKTGAWVDGDDADGFADPGEVINYTFEVCNTGNVTLTNVTVTDPLVTVVGGPTTLDVGECDTTTFTASYTITQDDIDAGQVDNTATADSDESEPDSDDETVLLPQNPDLGIVKEADPITYDAVGDVISYTITATNTGNVTLHNVTVADPGLTGFSCTPAVPVASLAPGGTIVCTGTHTITAADMTAGSFLNTACADSDETDPAVCDSVTVNKTELSQLAPTATTCEAFRDGTAGDQEFIVYNITKQGRIGSVSPGVFFYFTTVTVTAGQTVLIDQTETSVLPAFAVRDVTVYTPSCTQFSRPTCASTDALGDCSFTIGTSGTYIIRVRYDSQSLAAGNTNVCPNPPTDTYTFETLIGGDVKASDSLTVTKKPTAKCP